MRHFLPLSQRFLVYETFVKSTRLIIFILCYAISWKDIYCVIQNKMRWSHGIFSKNPWYLLILSLLVYLQFHLISRNIFQAKMIVLLFSTQGFCEFNIWRKSKLYAVNFYLSSCCLPNGSNEKPWMPHWLFSHNKG